MCLLLEDGELDNPAFFVSPGCYTNRANLMKDGVFLPFMPGQLCKVKKRKVVLDIWELAWCSLLGCGPLVELNTYTDHQHQTRPFCDVDG